MSALIYEYAKCSTCRNALKWLEKNNVAFTKVAIVESPPSAKDLKAYIERAGVPVSKFFNTSGQVYREMDLAKKIPSMTESEMINLLASNGKLIKRPLLVDPKGVLVGFKEEDYRRHFKG